MRVSYAWRIVAAMGFKARSQPTRLLFTDETFQFLGELEQNNDRGWFAANKERYEMHVREPALAFIRQMAPHIGSVSRHFDASDTKVGGALMRVHRDTRFSPDKTPYKTNIGIHFRHAIGKDVHAPGLYVHIALEGCFLGVGTWRPESASLARIRKRIVDSPKEWARARDDNGFRSFWQLTGESLKRMPRGFSEELPHADDLRRKDHTASATLTIGDILSSALVDFCGIRFQAATPYVRFLTRAVGAPF